MALANQLSFSRRVQLQAFPRSPFNPQRGTTKVSFPKRNTYPKVIYCGNPRFNQTPLNLNDFPNWVTWEPKALQGLHIMSKNYAPIIKLHLIFGAFYALGMTLRTFHQYLKNQTEAGEKKASDDPAQQKGVSTGKDKSDATARAKAQRIRRAQSKADQKALEAAIASYSPSEGNLIQSSISYIKFLEDKVKTLEEEMSKSATHADS